MTKSFSCFKGIYSYQNLARTVSITTTRSVGKNTNWGVANTDQRQTRIFSIKSHHDTTSNDDESKHRKVYTLNGIGNDVSILCRAENGSHIMQTDLPKRMGGSDTAPQPVELLLTSLLGCTQATAVFVARNLSTRRLYVEKIEYEDIQAWRDERGATSLPLEDSPSLPPARIQQVTGTCKIYCNTKDNKTRKLKNVSLLPSELKKIQEQTELRCPVANMMIASGCKLDIQWTDGNAQRI